MNHVALLQDLLIIWLQLQSDISILYKKENHYQYEVSFADINKCLHYTQYKQI